MTRALRVQVVPDGDALIEALGEVTAPRRVIFASQDSRAHGDCDLRLFEAICAVITPILGRWDDNDARWYHELDYYGEGIRHLDFQPGAFPIEAVPHLRALLTGEHEMFGILCWARTDLEPDAPEGVLIFSHITYVTPGFKNVEL